MSGRLRIALTKGRLQDKSVELFERMGASSTLPSILMMSTSIPFSAKKARVTAGYLEATRRVL